MSLQPLQFSWKKCWSTCMTITISKQASLKRHGDTPSFYISSRDFFTADGFGVLQATFEPNYIGLGLSGMVSTFPCL